MSSVRSQPGVRGAALLLVLCLAAPARALDVKLWPLFRWASDPAAGVVRWTALGPLVEWLGTRDRWELHVRPLLALHVHRDRADTRADVLFPLGAVRRTPEETAGRFLLFSWRVPAAGASTGPGMRFTLFPFVFWRDGPAGRGVGVLPFYLDLPDVFGYERVTAVLFPAYLALREPRVARRFHPFPFVSTVGGPDGDGFAVWPFYGTETVAGRERATWIAWPFHLRGERFVPGRGWERRRLDLPWYAAADGAGRTVRAYGALGYTHTIDEVEGYEATGAPWPLVFRARRLGEARWRTWRIAPVYGRIDEDHLTSRFWAWPLLRWQRSDRGEAHHERADLLLILARQERTWTEDTHRLAVRTTLFPLLRAAHDGDRRHGQVPALFDALLPTNRGVLSEWAPLWGLFRWDTAPDGARDWNLAWGLVAREGGRLRGPVHLQRGDHGG